VNGIQPIDERFTNLDAFVRRVHGEQDQLIQTLHVAQDLFGYLSHDVLLHVARALRLPASFVLGVATFYHLFRFDPPGDHVCTVCTGTACFVKGADEIAQAVSEEVGVAMGETTPDRRFTLGLARCIGSCGLAPVALLDGNVLPHQTPESMVAAVRTALASDLPAGTSDVAPASDGSVDGSGRITREPGTSDHGAPGNVTPENITPQGAS
jgi:bidirectional [NiFe] hydrogenase diaphorase subunit